MLALEELTKISEQIMSVIKYSQNYVVEDKGYGVQKLISPFTKNKNRFIKYYLNGELIYTFPEKMTFNINEEQKKPLMSQFYNEIETRIYEYATNGDEFYAFMRDQEDGFFQNVVKKRWVCSNDKIIPEGMKLSKAFKYFIQNERVLREIQDVFSTYVQRDKISGYLCISVHPLDFLSSSMNNHKWRSCHSLDGDFRAGNLSYMCDSCTMICYLRSDEETQLPLFPPDLKWNDKKWRMLIHIDENDSMIFFGRHYPFTIDGVNEIILDKLKEATNHHWISEWTEWNYENSYINMVIDDKNWHYEIEEPYEYLLLDKNHLVRKTDLIKEPDPSLHYNDLLFSSLYTKPYYAIRREKESGDILHIPIFNIGSEIKCPICGYNRLETGETLICWECLNRSEELSNDVEISEGDYTITELDNLAPEFPMDVDDLPF